MSEVELKPCPFCGGKAKVSKSDIDHFVVNCTKCPCSVGRYWFWKMEDAINMWNTRITI